MLQIVSKISTNKKNLALPQSGKFFLSDFFVLQSYYFILENSAVPTTCAHTFLPPIRARVTYLILFYAVHAVFSDYEGHFLCDINKSLNTYEKVE